MECWPLRRRSAEQMKSTTQFLPFGLHHLRASTGNPGHLCIGIAPQHHQFSCAPATVRRVRKRSGPCDAQQSSPFPDCCLSALQSLRDHAVRSGAEKFIFPGSPRTVVRHGRDCKSAEIICKRIAGRMKTPAALHDQCGCHVREANASALIKYRSPYRR